MLSNAIRNCFVIYFPISTSWISSFIIGSRPLTGSRPLALNPETHLTFVVIVIILGFVWSLICYHSRLFQTIVFNRLLDCLVRRPIAFGLTEPLILVVYSLGFLLFDYSWSQRIRVNCLWLLAFLGNHSQLSLTSPNSCLLGLSGNCTRLR